MFDGDGNLLMNLGILPMVGARGPRKFVHVVFDNEGHGFTKKANEIRGNKAILDFLDKYLKGGAAAAAGMN